MASIASQINRASVSHGGGKALFTGKELGIKLKSEIRHAILNSQIPENLKGELVNSIIVRTYGEDNSLVEVGFWGEPIKYSILDFSTPAFMPSVYNFPNHYKKDPMMYHGYDAHGNLRHFNLAGVRGKGSDFMGIAMRSFMSKYAANNGIVDMKLINA